MTPRFIYFDLGKVLLDFDPERMYRQIADVAGIGAEQVQAALAAGLQVAYELGKLDSRGVHEAFCRQTCTHLDYEGFSLACNDIFTPIGSMQAVVAQLYQAGHRLGILSNTCDGHWDYCLRRYGFLREFFSVYALSFEIGAAKPEGTIFHKAADLAGCRPDEIFYADDIAGHVAGARGVGYDAVVYTSTADLVEDLRRRNFAFNY
jgi:glucose-1-phosphatase